MNAMVYYTYGAPDVLKREAVEKPTPGDDEVLVKVAATSINAGDWLLLRGESLLARLMAGGANKPKRTILGMDVAGQVEAVGSRVQQFKPGDAVYGDVSACRAGAFAEYVTVAERYLAPKPANLTFEQAAAVPTAGVTALQGLRDKVLVQPGQHILINGASGGVGTFAVQLARAFGAEVTATCRTEKVETVRTLGAAHVIDYTREDVTRSEGRYDAILDIAAHRPFTDYARILHPKGKYIVAGGDIGRIFSAMLLGGLAALRWGRTFGSLSQKPKAADLLVMTSLLEAGTVVPVIDRCYPLDDVAEALRYFGGGHARGKVVVSVQA
jgi:NADPH:quinone reductase-like Zn-dependent oxidoreductase